MAESGRNKKVLLKVTSKYAIGIESDTFTVEVYSSTQGWRPVKWYGSLPSACTSILELRGSDHLVEMLGSGVTKISEELVGLLLKEVSADAKRIYLDSRNYLTDPEV